MNVPSLRYAARGRLEELSPEQRRLFTVRTLPEDPDLVEAVRTIIANVRRWGDGTLLELAARYDGVTLEALEVPKRLWSEAVDALSPAVRSSLERAATNIGRFHRAQIPAAVTEEVEPGVVVTRRWTPLASVGVYAPGGRAAYPSSVLMGVVPARAAGVPEIVVCSPPGPSGVPPAEVMAACALAGATRLFSVGGAGAVAAMAYGTTSVPAVDTIVGPGNRWVTEAKRQVAGHVPIDAPAGPSEVVVLADATASARLVARELLAQAEHDPEAGAVLVTNAPDLLQSVGDWLEELVPDEPRQQVIREALAAQGALLLAQDLDDAVSFAQSYAPEHLLVVTAEAALDAQKITTAGTIFVGPSASVAFGDYLTGANHVLPTSGRARSYPGLSVANYLRSYTVQEVTPAGAARMASAVDVLARSEGLPAHAAAAMERSRT